MASGRLVRPAGAELLLEEQIEGVQVMMVQCAKEGQAGVLREMLGGDYRADAHGRPVAEGAEISVSHAGDVVAVALRAGRPVGIDVEFGEEREWALKEAVSKALGLGAAVALEHIEVAFDPQPAVRRIYGSAAVAAGWRVAMRELTVNGRRMMLAVVF